MTFERDGRRSLPAALALLALVGCALISPVLFGGSRPGPGSAGYLNAASRDSFPIAAPVQLSRVPLIVLERGTITLSAAGAGPKPGQSLLALLIGRRADLVVSDAIITVHRSGILDAPVAAEPSQSLAPIVASLGDMEFRTLTLNGATVALRSANGATETLHKVSADIAHGRGREITAAGKLTYRGDDVAFDVALTRAGEGNEPSLPVRAKISSKHLNASFEGSLATSDRFQLKAPNAQLTVRNLRETAAWLGEQWPTGPGLGAFSATGVLIVDKDAATFENARITIDGNGSSGALTLALGHDRPSVQGTLAFDALNLLPYAVKQQTTAIALTNDWLASLRLPGLETPSLVREIDADLRISAKSVSMGSSNLGRCAASLNIKNGKLSADIAEVELEYGGSGEGRLDVDMTGTVPRYGLRTNLTGVDFGKLAARFSRPMLEGVGNLALDLAGEGSTDATVLASLSGKVAVDMVEGGRLGFNTDALAGAASANSSAAALTAVTASSITVDRVVARFTAERGVLTAEKVEASDAERMLTATGSFGLADRTVDLTLTLAPSRDAALARGLSTSAGSAATSAFRVRGPWRAPAITIVTRPGKSAEPSAAPALPGGPKVPG